MINDLWYKNAVIYYLSVATYMDANGDGVGDFEGLMRRRWFRVGGLDYLLKRSTIQEQPQARGRARRSRVRRRKI